MTTKSKKANTTAKTKQVNKNTLTVDFCPIYEAEAFDKELNSILLELEKNSIRYWTKDKNKTTEAKTKTNVFTKVNTWFKSLFKRK